MNATKHGWPSIKHLGFLLPFPSSFSLLPFLFLQFSFLLQFLFLLLLDSDESLLVTELSPPILGLQHYCRFGKRMQLNMGGLRLNTLFLYNLCHHLFLYLLFFFFNFPSFWSLYFFFFYSFFFYFLLQAMLIFTGLSWCHKFQLHFMSLMPQIKGTLIKIERFKMKPCPSKKKMTIVRGSNIT